MGHRPNMIVLGLSGLENSVPFKKASWPGLEEPEYRISQGHDSAAALVVDGQIVAAAAEERFSRKKHTGDFPMGAIQYCLSAAGIELGDIDEMLGLYVQAESSYRDALRLLSAPTTDPETRRALARARNNLGVLLKKSNRFAESETFLREALLVADHNAYHLGQLVDLRRALKIWPES